MMFVTAVTDWSGDEWAAIVLAIGALITAVTSNYVSIRKLKNTATDTEERVSRHRDDMVTRLAVTEAHMATHLNAYSDLLKRLESIERQLDELSQTVMRHREWHVDHPQNQPMHPYQKGDR